MKTIASMTSGLVSSVALTVLHQTLKNNVSHAPRMDKLGMEALGKTLDNAGIAVPKKKTLYYSAMVGDIAGNAGYYSLVGMNPKNSIATGAALGLMAGIGAIALPGKLGLKKRYSNESGKTQLLTLGLYVAAGLLAGAVHKLMDRKRPNRSV
ncbi:hypothetical protein SAMN05428949_1007 [Chitinophaga sp. YR627]|uniref:hypothetical protein n=1 Tax=Chitinophaga sp. YR627 TaxID=1881041 RepID=UPI0008EBD844|nr:hypothetical protein [Chitinophaga sp. YR627]SFM84429.1 hypothetical protein SAMN05428949_1007 [Chitinophaga sp. YR627]